MIDINDNDFKLLKMNESLLNRLSPSEGDIYYQALNNYEILSKKIEKNNFDAIIEKINNYTDKKHNLSLEEELDLLEELENDYRQLEELQHKLKKITNDLKLSDLSIINIDIISDRKNLISGYLINIKNIDNIHKELEKNNNQLILANKQKEAIERKYQNLEEDLKRNFISAEGRILIIGNKTLKNASIKEEYQSININLIEILNSEEKILEKLTEINNLKIEQDELLKTGEICYENIPTQENKEILDTLRKEAINTNYQLALIKIIKLISTYENSFDKMIEKREKIKDLIKRRNKYLEEHNIKFSIDPFTRIKLEEQINYIIELGDNTKEINAIRKNINELDQKLEILNEKKNNFLVDLAREIKILEDKTSLKDIDVSKVELIEDKSSEKEAEKISTEKYEQNQVVTIEPVDEKFKIERVIEKSSSVIKRVNEIFNKAESANKKNNTIVEQSPELIIDSIENLEPQKENNSIFEITDINEEITESPTNESEKKDSTQTLEEVEPIDETTKEFFDIAKENNSEEEINDLYKIPVEEISKSSDIEIESEDNNQFLQEVESIDEITEEFFGTNKVSNNDEIESTIFENNQEHPFNSIEFFNDKLDEEEVTQQDDYYLNKDFEDKITVQDDEFDILYNIQETTENNKKQEEEIQEESETTQMPEAFWESLTEPNPEEEPIEVEPSFDDQIKKLKLTV